MSLNILSSQSTFPLRDATLNSNFCSLSKAVTKLGKINSLALIGYVAAAAIYPFDNEAGIILGIGTAFTASIGNLLAGNRVSALFHTGVIAARVCIHKYNSELDRSSGFNEFQIKEENLNSYKDVISSSKARLDKILNLKNQGIVMGEYGVTNKDSGQPIIESFGANPCVVVAMRNEKTSRTVLAHIHALTKVPQAIKMLEKEALKAGHGKLAVELASGCIEDNPTLVKIKESILKNRNMNLKVIHHAKRLAMDARFGNTSTESDLLDYSIIELNNMAVRSFKGALSSSLILGADGTSQTKQQDL